MKNYIEKFLLKGQVIIITGAAGLLGKMHTKAVIEAGGIPILIDINSKRMENNILELTEEYGEFEYYKFIKDITNNSQMKQVLTDIIKKYSRIDGLINNACINPSMNNLEFGEGRFETYTYQAWLEETEVGLYGAICCSQVFGGYFANHGGGVILNITSDLGIIAPNQDLYRIDGQPEDLQPKKPVTYSTIKWGLIGLTKYISTYWAKSNVRANAVAFGGVYNNQNNMFLKRVKEVIPIGRLANKDEYICTVIFMLSSASSYMTGSIVVIDGGRTAW